MFILKNNLFHSCSLARRVKHIVHQAFWDVLESELNAEPPEYEHAIKLFEEIREVSLPCLYELVIVFPQRLFSCPPKSIRDPF